MASQTRGFDYAHNRNSTAGSQVITDATDHVTTAITATGATDSVEVKHVNRVAIGVVNGATNSVVFTVEGSLDGTNFSTIAYGSGSSAAYTQSSKTVTGGSKAILYIPPDDFVYFVRVNIATANANGTTFTVYGG